jgi:pimeloyl-ACP methyl ester carboxylesterase
MADSIQIVMIPALLCDDAMYAEVIAGLGDEIAAQVVVVPRPTMAQSVAEILARAPQRFVLAGTSYGASLALEVALAAPSRVQALWLMGCDPGATDPEEGAGLVSMIETRTEAAIAQFAGVVVHADAHAAAETFRQMARRIGGEAGGAQMRALAAQPAMWNRLDELTLPVLVLAGEDDALVPLATAEKLARALTHARFHALPRCGHLATLEQPAAVVEIARTWLHEDLHAHG